MCSRDHLRLGICYASQKKTVYGTYRNLRLVSPDIVASRNNPQIFRKTTTTTTTTTITTTTTTNSGFCVTGQFPGDYSRLSPVGLPTKNLWDCCSCKTFSGQNVKILKKNMTSRERNYELFGCSIRIANFGIRVYCLFVCLGFNGTFSTNRLPGISRHNSRKICHVGAGDNTNT